jgi:hypothetical protein
VYLDILEQPVKLLLLVSLVTQALVVIVENLELQDIVALANLVFQAIQVSLGLVVIQVKVV